MIKCSSCNGTLLNDETTCFVCGTPVPQLKAKKPFVDRCRTLLKIAFIASGVLTLASLFTDYTPSFVKCLVTTVVLMLVKSSADQMAESKH